MFPRRCMFPRRACGRDGETFHGSDIGFCPGMFPRRAHKSALGNVSPSATRRRETGKCFPVGLARKCFPVNAASTGKHWDVSPSLLRHWMFPRRCRDRHCSDGETSGGMFPRHFTAATCKQVLRMFPRGRRTGCPGQNVSPSLPRVNVHFPAPTGKQF